MKEKLLQYMNETFFLEFNNGITEESDLFKAGIIDSYGYLKLIKFIESEFSIKFTEEEILSNVFVTFTSIVDCISKKNSESLPSQRRPGSDV